jgi:SPP1 family phage portal protein
MKTYQDLVAVGDQEDKRMEFVKAAIDQHKGTAIYQEAVVAEEYNAHQNRTINQYRKLLYTISGRAVPDNYSANWKMASRFFHIFVCQEVQHLLGNGVTWDKKNKKAAESKFGQDFDNRLQELGKDALIGGVAFGFYNLDHMDVFKVTEFAPLYDEENGALMAGIRFWQVSDDKPLRATLYEVDGYTDYIWIKSEPKVLKDKRPYKLKLRETPADGVEIYDGENYPTFPIVPLWGNPERQSELVGLREQIDCYDLIKSGFANDLDDASQIYWTIQNAGGMDDVDLAKFLERMKTVKAAVVEDTGARAEAHTMEVPYNAREVLLARIKRDLYNDAMALDPADIAAGAVTATQIKAAYEPLNSKCDEFEYCIRDFLDGLTAVAGLDEYEVTFTRSMIVNTLEQVQVIATAANFLDREYIVEKILTALGDGDLAEDMISKLEKEEQERMTQAMQQMAAQASGGQNEGVNPTDNGNATQAQ